MDWYVLFKEPGDPQPQMQYLGDKDGALLAACDLYLRGKQVLCVGTVGDAARADQAIEGDELQSLLRSMITK
jgi:hypothetical protein